MKKFLAIAIIAASFTACNGGEKTEEVKVDSPAVTTETPAPAVVDTPATPAPAMDTASKMAADTAKAAK